MGFELLAIITSQNFNILSDVDAENISLSLMVFLFICYLLF